MQHFISQSPWSGRAMIAEIQEQMIASGVFAKGSMLLLDESGEEKAGESSVGVARQSNGRQGTVDNSQVGVYLTLCQGSLATWVDGEIFIPQAWLGDQATGKRQKVGLAEGRRFQTKPELG